MNKLLTLLFCVFIISGCDKVCRSSVDESATFVNQTGYDLSVVVCKNSSDKIGAEPVEINLNSGTANQLVPTGTVGVQRIEGGLNAAKSCSAGSYSYQPSTLALSQESLGDGKLCRSNGTSYAVVPNAGSCPAGTQAQITAADCQ